MDFFEDMGCLVIGGLILLALVALVVCVILALLVAGSIG
jgi:hypothetical protein